MWDKLRDASSFSHIRKIELHVSGVFLELIKQLLWRRAHDIVNLDHLIEFIITREEGEKGKNFEKHTSYSPKIHFISIISVC